MQRILLDVKKVMRHATFVFSLVTLIALSSLFIFTANPSYAITSSKDKLSADEKIDRAYQFREGTGFLEEDKQESPSANQTMRPEEEAKEKSVKASNAETEDSLGQKAREFVEKITQR